MGDAIDEKEGEEEISVRVYVRIRPLNKREWGENQTIGWNFNKTSDMDLMCGERLACLRQEG